ncbi:Glutamate receptor [Melia azedarach]|uniref:Glutamate receptor n=1 Tax=Melia azedarach TaxID=155640 RepID=A0ACC1YRP2_MELAZ|nr:Glutamate receptor [Melia azedarach]
MVLVCTSTQKATGDHEAAEAENNNYHVKGIIVAVGQNSSRIGKEQRIAMEMAVDDFNGSGNHSLLLYTRNSTRQPVHTALAALELINSEEVEAILGPQTWDETSLVAEIASNKQIPLLTFAEAMPNWATEKWPFLLQASPNQFAQMKAVAAIVQSWDWHQVTVIYEDIDSSAAGVIPHLSNALREVGAQIMDVLPLPPFPSSEIAEKLGKLKSGQCRVFVVHLSLELALPLFEQANKLEMMEKGYVWITTDAITSLLHSIDASTMSLMQGILGVRSYFPENKPQFQQFYRRFCKRFGSEYPEEDNHEPGALAVQAYDALWSVALAMKEVRSEAGNKKLFEGISHSDFGGLTGNFQFRSQKVASADIYQIINLKGNTPSKLGFWTEGRGFSHSINENAAYNSSMKDLGKILWPGLPPYTPRGWSLPTSAKSLRIGVPIGSEYKDYVNVLHAELGNAASFKGFVIELFNATVERLPFHLQYNFFPFNGSYDNLVKQIYLEKFDAVVGDVAILAKRCKYADFTPPFTESGLVMVVPVRKSSNKPLLFVKPFTKAMWILILAVSIYNGFVVWLIERKHWPEQQNSAQHQTGMFLWLSFSSLTSLHGEKLHSNLSRMMMVVWLFVALIITQTYTANLTSMLTIQGFEPTADNIESLQSANATVGCANLSFASNYLRDVLHFNSRNIRGYASIDDYASDLRSGKISAVFIEVPLHKIFLARYCKSFTTAGPIHKVGGFGFAFPKGSPLLPRVTEALLNVSESGKLQELENKIIASQKCMEVDLDEKDKEDE